MYDTKMELTKKKEWCNQLALRVYTKVSTDPENLSSISHILTKSEKIIIGRRLLIAQAILNGKTRRELQDEIGISPNTFAQVNRWLESEFKEYLPFVVTTPIHTSSKLTTRSRRVQPFSYEDLKRSYPMHFLLFSIAESVWKQAQK